jgi:hypothetical protein
MIVEILKQEDVNRIDDALLRSYLDYSLQRLPDGFDYFEHVGEFGNFCIITEGIDLMGESIALSHWTLPSIREEPFWTRIELIEVQHNGENGDVVEILVRIDTDVMVSLICREGILEDGLKDRIHLYASL